MLKRIAVFVVLALVFALAPTGHQARAFDDTVFASTPLSGSTRARLSNVRLSAEALDGVRVDYGDEFSFNDHVGPRTERYGYQTAINGRGIKVVGGGVAQAASTLYLALKQLDAIDYTEKKTYGARYNGKYVDSSRDAVLVEYPDTDFSFINDHGTFDIAMWIEDSELCCELTLRQSGRAIGSMYLSIDGNRATRTNVSLATGSIYETLLYPGDEFSFNDIVGPRTERNGYVAALNGRGVKVTGGGVAQVASCVYLAVKDLDCVRITSKKTYGSRYNQSYVDHEDDAILTDYNEKIDFRFRYTGNGVLSIYTEVDGNAITCDVYESFG